MTTLKAPSNHCNQWIRHLSIFIDPRELRKHGIEFRFHNQKPGEAVVIESSSYHEALNTGENLTVRRIYRNIAFGKGVPRNTNNSKKCLETLGCPKESIASTILDTPKMRIRSGPIKTYNLTEIGQIQQI